MLVYPKGSSLRCLTGLSLAAGILQIISSIVAIATAIGCGACAALMFLMGDAVSAIFSQMSLVDSSFGFVMAFGGYFFVAALVAFVLLSVLTVRQARFHMARRKMLRLYPSQSGLRVYRWPLALSLLGLTVSLGLVLSPLAFSGDVFVAFVPLAVAFVAEIATWAYYKVNFDKMLKEVG